MKKLVLIIAASGLLCQCDEHPEVYGWTGATADDSEAVAVYEYEMIFNSLPPCGE